MAKIACFGVGRQLSVVVYASSDSVGERVRGKSGAK
jgi:hypothetical protein